MSRFRRSNIKRENYKEKECWWPSEDFIIFHRVLITTHAGGNFPRASEDPDERTAG
jgi:hypothetical protein